MSSLTKSQEKELKDAFQMFDRDGSGKISARELKSIFKALEIEVSDKDIRSTIKQMDVDGDGEINFNEFKRVMGAQYYRKYSNDEIRAAFDHFDKDNSGFITSDELQNALSKLGKSYRKEEIDRMIRSIDKDGNGKISLNEFIHLLD